MKGKLRLLIAPKIRTLPSEIDWRHLVLFSTSYFPGESWFRLQFPIFSSFISFFFIILHFYPLHQLLLSASFSSHYDIVGWNCNSVLPCIDRIEGKDTILATLKPLVFLKFLTKVSKFFLQRFLGRHLLRFLFGYRTLKYTKFK